MFELLDFTIDLLTVFGGSDGEKLVATSPVHFRSPVSVKAEMPPQSTAMLSTGM